VPSVLQFFSRNRYMQYFSLSLIVQTAEEKVPVWYIMDEFGSRIQHSDQPSFATAPLFYMPQQIAYTVLWPLRDLETGGKLSLRVCLLLLLFLMPSTEGRPYSYKSLSTTQHNRYFKTKTTAYF